MADKKFGQKRVCSNCEVKFYDLNKKSPLICPHCKHEILIEEELLFSESINQAKQQNKNEIKDEFSELENTDNTDNDEVISLDDAVMEEEEQETKN
ncbi:MAG: TIGR02300 family protein [Pelagibacteraceae bacterium]|jgi:uncharacterized protein (TIGR02300 family)|nr:TIGR02300 family protein [Pelagibacteraceae bacterium]MCI5079629.1 TIGR02300 family protein [Pelagibacteraceae bacterium]